MNTGGAIVFELRRALASRRWGVMALVAVLVAWLAESSVRAASFNARAAAHAEDVVLAAVNNVALVGYLLLPAFVLVVSGTLAADRSSGFALLTLPRAGSRGGVWAAKVVTVVACAVLAQGLLLLASFGTAVALGYAPSGSPSALALLPESEASVILAAPARLGDQMTLRVAAAATFLALVFAAFGVMALAASVIWSQESVPPALVLGVVFFDWLIARFAHWPWYAELSPSAHMLESMHISTLPDTIPWLASIGYFVLWLLGAAMGGWWLFERKDV